MVPPNLELSPSTQVDVLFTQGEQMSLHVPRELLSMSVSAPQRAEVKNDRITVSSKVSLWSKNE
jgi:hypothetical protein